MKIFKLIVLSTFLMNSCTNQEKQENTKASVETKLYDLAIIKTDLLDTVLYQNRAFPPRGLLAENLEGAPIIVEGRIINADSISAWNDMVITFKIDSVWKGNIDIDTIKYRTFNETTVRGYESWKKHKTLAFIKKRKKEKLYNYPDSIEYSPYVDFSVFPLDKNFREYMIKLYDEIVKKEK